MKDVSCRAVARFTAKAGACGIGADSLLSGLGLPPKSLLNRRNFVSWDVFSAFAERLEELAGSRKAVIDVCMAESTGPFERAIRHLLSWTVSPVTLYRLLRRVFPRIYPCLGFEMREIGYNRMAVRVRIPHNRRVCAPALNLAVGCLRVFPRWIGHPDAEIEAEFREREAEYLVKLPPSRSFAARAGRFWSILVSGRSAVEILQRQAEELKASYAQLHATKSRLERDVAAASHLEQGRIAASLENRLGATLDRLADAAAALAKKLRNVSPEAETEATAVWANLLEAISLAKDLAHGLDPIGGRGGTLEQALEDLAARTRNLCGVSCEFNRIGAGWPIGHAASLNLYRLSQEAINNSIRHGQAQRIRILMASADDVRSLSIADDGVGIRDAPKSRTGRGTKIMRYRAAMVGGSLVIESEPGRGSTVSCVMKSPFAAETQPVSGTGGATAIPGRRKAA